jgi:membrane dipeptidase
MTPPDETLRRALALLERVPLVDGHNDLPWVIHSDKQARGDVRRYDLGKIHPEGDTDLPRLRAGRVGTQVFAAFIPTDTPHPARATLELIDIILRIQQTYPDDFLPITEPGQIMAAKRVGRIGALLAVEGGVGLENSLAPLRVWHQAGARLMTLCHNGTLDWIDSATDKPRHGGLTAFGRAVVAELNRLGMMVDCAHVSDDAMRQVLDISAAPVVFSHSNARALCDHPRNIPDDVLEMVRAKDGLVMATFVPNFISDEARRWMLPLNKILGDDFTATREEKIAAYEAEHGKRPRATLSQLADHIEYFAAKVGPERVGIGSDFFGVPSVPEGLENVSRFPHLIAELMRRGWSDDAVAGVAGLNFIRIFTEVERIGQRLRKETSPVVARVADLDAVATAQPL